MQTFSLRVGTLSFIPFLQYPLVSVSRLNLFLHSIFFLFLKTNSLVSEPFSPVLSPLFHVSHMKSAAFKHVSAEDLSTVDQESDKSPQIRLGPLHR